jgi:hypothetical protein
VEEGERGVIGLRWAMPLALAAVACAAGGAGGDGGSTAGARAFPPEATVRRDPATGAIRFLEAADLARDLDGDPAFRAARASGDATRIARAFLAAHAAGFRLQDPGEELALREVRPDLAGRRIVVFDQRWRGLPVLRGELRVHVDAQGHVPVVNGSTIPTPEQVESEPALDAAAARARAAAALGQPPGACAACRTELVVTSGGAPRLAWRVRPPRGALHDELVLDARDGTVLERVPVAWPGGPRLDLEGPR